jgi:hypothetical protein
MSADPALMQQLNPGMALRSYDEGAVAPGTNLPSPAHGVSGLHALGSQPPGSPAAQAAAARAVSQLQSAPVLASTSGAFAASRSGRSDGVFDELSGLSGTYEPRRSGASVIGWLFLAALIFGGVGVVLYVALGERAGRTPPPAAGAVPAADAGNVPVNPAPDAAPRPDGSAVDPGPRDAPKDDVKPKERDDKKERDRDRDKERDKKAVKDKVEPAAAVAGVPASADEAKKLSAEAKSKLKAADWDGAYEAYSRLAKSSYLKKDAQLGMAHASWQLNQVDRTIKHAEAAMKAGAGVEAKKMLGHAYFKKGNYKQALTYYDAILAKDPGDKEVSDAAAAARKRLKK